MNWLRLYSELRHDRKVQCLPAELFRAYINLLCLASEQPARGSLPCRVDIAWELRVDEEQAARMLDQLTSAGLVDTEGDEYRIHGWDKRQYESDDVNARVRKHREKQARNTPDVAGNVSGNVTSALHETHQIQIQNQIQNRTDTEGDTARATTAKQSEKRVEPNPKPPKAPTKKTSIPAHFEVTDKMLDWVERTLPDLKDVMRATDEWADYCLREDAKFANWEAAWRQGMRKALEFQREREARNGKSNGKSRQQATEEYFAAIFNANGAGASPTPIDRPRLRGGPPETA